ncbi:MAG: NAD+ diphosphatase [Flavobacteriales bacterium]|jgi:NAD+ diphosphatase
MELEIGREAYIQAKLADNYIVFVSDQIAYKTTDTSSINVENILHSGADIMALDLPETLPLIGELNGRSVAIVQADDRYLKVGIQQITARELLQYIGGECFQLISRALQLRNWMEHYQYCSRCAEPLTLGHTEHAKICNQCEHHYYPRISPCVIGVILKGKKILLARHTTHGSGMYSAIAGFIEAGETPEQAFVREAYEEVGVRVNNLRYIESQTWPFPGQIMIGFMADYQSGELVLEPGEIEDAGWFEINDLPITPPKFTIAGKLIDAALKAIGS